MEAAISEICASFNCPPDVAVRQPWPLVKHVLDYRVAKRAVDVFRQGSGAFDELNASPEMQGALLAMHRAQQGDEVTIEQVHALMAAQGVGTEDEEGG